MIQLKSPREIEKMAKAGAIIADVFVKLKSFIVPGVSTLDIADEAERIIVEAGAVASFKGYGEPPFPSAVCVSVDDEVVHGIPLKENIIREGQIVSVDVGTLLDGWNGDAARTYMVGEQSAEVKKLVKGTEEAFWAGFEAARVGNRIGDVSYAIQKVAQSYGFGIVKELTGHGIGRKLHEEPSVLNYGVAGKGPRIQEGLVIAIEPMLTLGTSRIEILDDDWTIVTADSSMAAHYENTVAITAEGPRALTWTANAGI